MLKATTDLSATNFESMLAIVPSIEASTLFNIPLGMLSADSLTRRHVRLYPSGAVSYCGQCPEIPCKSVKTI
jgi:hypothetical protein